MGELIEDDPNALFKRDQIEKQRVKLAPTLKRIVVAVDPPAGFGKKSNACGLVVAGTDGNGNVSATFTMGSVASTVRATAGAWDATVTGAERSIGFSARSEPIANGTARRERRRAFMASPGERESEKQAGTDTSTLTAARGRVNRVSPGRYTGVTKGTGMI